ncbi:MAG: hypothetical protein ACYDH3_01385 [Candidatus Aminicenantales bacterium]
MNAPDGKRVFGRRVAGSAVVALAAFFFISARAAGSDVTAAMKQDAARLQTELDRIEALAPISAAHPRQSVAFSERELNSWLACLLEADKKNALRELVLKLFDDNRIEGKAYVDLSGASLPLGIKPKMTLFFAAQVIVSGGTARVEFNKLFLEGQPIPVALVDMMIAAAAKFGKSDAASILDSVALPRGLEDLRSRKGQIVLYY